MQAIQNIIIITVVLIALLCAGTCRSYAQMLKIGDKVSQATVRDSNNEPVKLPYFGEKHLLIFYPDPDKASQNQAFTDYLEEHQIDSDNIYSFGVVNLKDAPLIPNALIRSIIRGKEKKTGATIYTDPAYLLRDAWNMGEINNLFVIVFVTKDGEVEFYKKGEMCESDIKEFFEVIDKYR